MCDNDPPSWILFNGVVPQFVDYVCFGFWRVIVSFIFIIIFFNLILFYICIESEIYICF